MWYDPIEIGMNVRGTLATNPWDRSSLFTSDMR